MKSLVVKRSIFLAGRKTSVSLEDEFWTTLKEIAGDRHVTLSELVSGINKQRQHSNLSSTLRLFVLEYYVARRQRSRATKCSANNRRHPRLYFRKRDLRYLFLLRQGLAADGERGHLRPRSRLAFSPADSFRLRASTSMRNCPTRSAS
jgi:predicted DNA-binding ribbon-helix-helix protein